MIVSRYVLTECSEHDRRTLRILLRARAADKGLVKVTLANIGHGVKEQ